MNILPTDQKFYDSPNAGEYRCKCSRCMRQIPEEQVPLRVLPPEEEVNEADDYYEYRFCDDCLPGVIKTIV